MRKILQSFLVACIVGSGIFFSCQRQISWEQQANNKPPIALAGSDQVITLPTDSISLDGSTSNDPDGTISEWLWSKISGPASFNVANLSYAKTGVAGIYKLELRIKDDESLQAKDMMQVTVDDPRIHRPPIANARPDQSIILPTNSTNLEVSFSTVIIILQVICGQEF